MSKKQSRKMYRHGDVLLVEAVVRTDAPIIRPDAGRNILAYGEVTGHAHVLERDDAVVYGYDKTSPLQVKVVKTAPLTHEEHYTINLPAALYDLPEQVEETPEVVRRVED